MGRGVAACLAPLRETRIWWVSGWPMYLWIKTVSMSGVDSYRQSFLPPWCYLTVWNWDSRHLGTGTIDSMELVAMYRSGACYIPFCNGPSLEVHIYLPTTIKMDHRHICNYRIIFRVLTHTVPCTISIREGGNLMTQGFKLYYKYSQSVLFSNAIDIEPQHS